MATDPLPRLRRLCLALPEATERLSHGEPTWFVRAKTTFVTRTVAPRRLVAELDDGPRRPRQDTSPA